MITVALWFDRIARLGLAAGVTLMLQPVWSQGFRYGFFVTVLFTVMHIVTSRLRVSTPEVQVETEGVS